MSISFQQLIKSWAAQLTQYDPGEAENLVYWLLEHHLGIKRVDAMLLVEEEELSKDLLKCFDRLKTGEPIQYILQKAPFYGREFLVSPDTLIPRNETEELVHLIIKENKAAGLKILDIGTGSGCIPVTLALEMNKPDVHALDISEPALRIASENAKLLQAKVDFQLCDILHQSPDIVDLDILVSNPPYVLESDKSQMHTNVLAYEPWVALFVPDEDPLLFYRTIAEKGKQLLRPGGKIYFEIHETKGKSIRELLVDLGYLHVKVLKDLNGKDRISSAVLP